MRFVSFLTMVLLSQLVLSKEQISVAIILDDIGHNYTRGRQALELKGAFTYAILPQTRHARQLANEAHDLKKEIMVHVPMESISGAPYGTGGEGLDRFMTRQEFDKILGNLIDSIPHASGVNNHQGSMLTQQTTAMHWLMDEVSKRRMYFIDSRTSGETVAQNVASVRQIFSGTRDVFLDVEQTRRFVDRSFRKLIRVAKRNGTAIAIGHPHKVTINYLENAQTALRHEGIQLVPASNLIALQQIKELKHARSAAQLAASGEGE